MSRFLENRNFYFGVFSIILFALVFSFLVLTPSDIKDIKLNGNRAIYSTGQRTFITPSEPERESPDLCIIKKNSLMAASPPIIITPQVLGVLVQGSNFDAEQSAREIIEYIVQPGDNLSSIAARFNISLDTILWANNLSKTTIQIGQKLIIPPVSGVIHYVEKYETLSAIAKVYKADLDEIIVFNALENADDIFIGDILIVPDGEMPVKKIYAPTLAPLASSYFICPISAPCRVTQWLHWYNAIDFSHIGMSCGEPIFAAAQGVVQRTGYGSLSGNFVRILHPNNIVTSYGHLQNISVKPGQKVSQGDIIGYMGHTGYTIPAGPMGCHLHFEVRGARNPFAR